MARKGDFVVRETPDVKVVDAVDASYLLEVGLDFICVQVRRSGFKNEHEALLKGQPRGPQDDYREYVGADGVDEPATRPDEYNSRRDDHAHRVEQVAEDVQEGRIDVQIPLLLLEGRV